MGVATRAPGADLVEVQRLFDEVRGLFAHVLRRLFAALRRVRALEERKHSFLGIFGVMFGQDCRRDRLDGELPSG